MNAPNQPIDKFVLAVQELSTAKDLDVVMKIVKNAARDISGADGATFILMEDDNCFYAEENAIAPLWKGSRFPMNSCISGWVMKNKESVVIEDIYQDDRIPADLYKPTFVKSLAMLPIRKIDPIGAIGNYWARHYTPTSHELSMLQSLADFTAIAIENININSQLEQRVKDRTVDLEKANLELEAFSYAVSHDLRAPLRTISTYMHMLNSDCETKFDDENKKVVTKIQTRIESMQRLIENLLSLFSLGNNTIKISRLNMKDIANAVFLNIKEEQPNRTMEFILHDLPAVDADSILMHQVWYNLISNAAKFTKLNDMACIEIGYLSNNDEIVYTVKDNGVGFSMEYYEKLFGVFNRLHTQKEFEGNGIGLTIVHRIIEKHNGKVWAHAKENEGAIFYFSLPK